MSATQYSCQIPSGMTALQWSEAALMIPLFQACGTVSLPCECASSAMRSVSVMPPQRVTSGCTRSTWARSISSRKPHHVASCSPAVTRMSTASASSAYASYSSGSNGSSIQ